MLNVMAPTEVIAVPILVEEHFAIDELIHEQSDHWLTMYWLKAHLHVSMISH